MNASDPNELVSFMENKEYSQVVTEPTHIRGGLIDHIYLSNAFRRSISFHVILQSVYYSDHDAIKLLLLFQNHELSCEKTKKG